MSQRTFRDEKGRTHTDESIAIDWMGRNRERAMQALGESRARGLPRQFAVEAEANPDGESVRVRPADPDEAT